MQSPYIEWAARHKWSDRTGEPLYDFPNLPGDGSEFPTDPLYAVRSAAGLIDVAQSARKLCSDFFGSIAAPLVLLLEQLIRDKMSRDKVSKLMSRSLDKRPELAEHVRQRWSTLPSQRHAHSVALSYAQQVARARHEEQARLLILDWQRDYTYDYDEQRWVDKKAS